VEKRLAVLETNQKVVTRNDEALGDLINLKTFVGKTDEAILLMESRIFSIWEGGNAFNTGQAWADAHLIRGLKRYKSRRYSDALADFKAALTPPENLRAQQGRNSRNVQIAYWTGCAYEALGENDKAKQSWDEVINAGSRSNRSGFNAQGRAFGNSPLAQGELRYYVALAQKKLGSADNSENIFRELADAATNTGSTQPDNTGDPQFVAARRQPSRDNIALPHYISGLGYAGLGNKSKAREEFNAALDASPDFLSAKIALDLL
jgi:tetratricopeptide (TPR) repeat protein